MSRVDLLREARQAYTVLWGQFVKSFAKKPDDLYCFYEGDDAKYYGMRIDSFIRGEGRETLNCKGKGSVIRLFELIFNSSEYNHAWVAFFIDKDFDELTELPADERMYVTPCYSIENLYVSVTAFVRCLKDEFQISNIGDNSSEFEAVVNLYERLLNEFNDASEELNAWIYLVRQAEKRDPGRQKVMLNQIKFEDFFTVSLDSVSKRYDLEAIYRIFTEISGPSQNEVDAQVGIFRGQNRVDIFRGKFLIEFYRRFLTQLKEDRCKRFPKYFKEHGTVFCVLSKINLISELSQYADTRLCLIDFLRAMMERRPAPKT